MTPPTDARPGETTALPEYPGDCLGCGCRYVDHGEPGLACPEFTGGFSRVHKYRDTPAPLSPAAARGAEGTWDAHGGRPLNPDPLEQWTTRTFDPPLSRSAVVSYIDGEGVMRFTTGTVLGGAAATDDDWYDEDKAMCACGHSFRDHSGKSFHYACARVGCPCQTFHAAHPEPTPDASHHVPSRRVRFVEEESRPGYVRGRIEVLEEEDWIVTGTHTEHADGTVTLSRREYDALLAQSKAELCSDLLVARSECDELRAAPAQVTRFEVIDHRKTGAGRSFVANGIKVELSYQDDGRTLKVLVTDRAALAQEEGR